MHMRRKWILLAVCALSACGRATPPGIEITEARAPATPPGASVAAVYAKLRAHRDDKLVRAETPLAETVEMHSTSHENGMMQMRPTSSVELPAGAMVEFAPGALHLMLTGLREPLVAQRTFPITFHFENAGDVSVEVAIVAPDEMQH